MMKTWKDKKDMEGHIILGKHEPTGPLAKKGEQRNRLGDGPHPSG